jgi:hypothetical protein
MRMSHPWSERFLSGLPPWGERSMAVFLLVMAFVMGVCVGLMLAANWEVGRLSRETQRRIAEMPLRPTLPQRLDAIEQRLQAIEQHLTP